MKVPNITSPPSLLVKNYRKLQPLSIILACVALILISIGILMLHQIGNDFAFIWNWVANLAAFLFVTLTFYLLISSRKVDASRNAVEYPSPSITQAEGTPGQIEYYRNNVDQKPTGPLSNPSGKFDVEVELKSQKLDALSLPSGVYSTQEDFPRSTSPSNRPLNVAPPRVPSATNPSTPKNIYSFIVPLEGNDPAECDDKVFFEENTYAVTDGVSRTFLKAKWADIIAHEWVKKGNKYSDERDFHHWLGACSQQWDTWARTEWIPGLRFQSAWDDFDAKLEKGAQTTLVSCSIDAGNFNNIEIKVWAVGDSNFFLFRPPESKQSIWTCIGMYPHESPDTLSNRTPTISTAEKHWRTAWEYSRPKKFFARSNDCIVLATDKLAIWLLTRLQRDDPAWMQVLSKDTEQAFRDFVDQERNNNTLERDDTTMLVVPLPPPAHRREA